MATLLVSPTCGITCHTITPPMSGDVLAGPFPLGYCTSSGCVERCVLATVGLPWPPEALLSCAVRPALCYSHSEPAADWGRCSRFWTMAGHPAPPQCPPPSSQPHNAQGNQQAGQRVRDLLFPGGPAGAGQGWQHPGHILTHFKACCAGSASSPLATRPRHSAMSTRLDTEWYRCGLFFLQP